MTAELTDRAIDWVGVVVPAHNEADYLPGCLQALNIAIAEVSVTVDVVVVLDACQDESSSAAAAFRCLPIEAHNVGAARRAGFAALLKARHEAVVDERCWLATTDADTLVPHDWLARMLVYADEGWDAVAGTVQVTDWADHWGEAAERVRQRWLNGYDGTDHHHHVHGANLGMRADCYLQVGGMPAVALSEDASLVTAMTAAGRRVRHAADLPVLTSSRSTPRARGGFGTLLEGLSA
jgi:glycosyltransferase involved in cell wall biosynthesis